MPVSLLQISFQEKVVASICSALLKPRRITVQQDLKKALTINITLDLDLQTARGANWVVVFTNLIILRFLFVLKNCDRSFRGH